MIYMTVSDRDGPFGVDIGIELYILWTIYLNNGLKRGRNV